MNLKISLIIDTPKFRGSVIPNSLPYERHTSCDLVIHVSSFWLVEKFTFEPKAANCQIIWINLLWNCFERFKHFEGIHLYISLAVYVIFYSDLMVGLCVLCNSLINEQHTKCHFVCTVHTKYTNSWPPLMKI